MGEEALKPSFLQCFSDAASVQVRPAASVEISKFIVKSMGFEVFYCYNSYAILVIRAFVGILIISKLATGGSEDC